MFPCSLNEDDGIVVCPDIIDELKLHVEYL